MAKILDGASKPGAILIISKSSIADHSCVAVDRLMNDDFPTVLLPVSVVKAQINFFEDLVITTL